MLTKISDNINEYYDLYSTTPEGIELREILMKIDKHCSHWMHHFEVEKLRRELFVQIMEWGCLTDDEPKK